MEEEDVLNFEEAKDAIYAEIGELFEACWERPTRERVRRLKRAAEETLGKAKARGDLSEFCVRTDWNPLYDPAVVGTSSYEEYALKRVGEGAEPGFPPEEFRDRLSASEARPYRLALTAVIKPNRGVRLVKADWKK